MAAAELRRKVGSGTSTTWGRVGSCGGLHSRPAMWHACCERQGGDVPRRKSAAFPPQLHKGPLLEHKLARAGRLTPAACGGMLVSAMRDTAACRQRATSANSIQVGRPAPARAAPAVTLVWHPSCTRLYLLSSGVLPGLLQLWLKWSLIVVTEDAEVWQIKVRRAAAAGSARAAERHAIEWRAPEGGGIGTGLGKLQVETVTQLAGRAHLMLAGEGGGSRGGAAGRCTAPVPPRRLRHWHSHSMIWPLVTGLSSSFMRRARRDTTVESVVYETYQREYLRRGGEERGRGRRSRAGCGRGQQPMAHTSHAPPTSSLEVRT